MDPRLFLWIILGISAAAAATQILIEIRRCRDLRNLALQWQMQFFPDDRFRLAARVAGRLPHPAASEVRVRNLMFRTDQDCRRYLFTVEYGVGALGGQRRRRCVVALDEVCRERMQPTENVTIAPAELAVIEQYQKLHEAGV